LDHGFLSRRPFKVVESAAAVAGKAIFTVCDVAVAGVYEIKLSAR